MFPLLHVGSKCHICGLIFTTHSVIGRNGVWLEVFLCVSVTAIIIITKS